MHIPFLQVLPLTSYLLLGGGGGGGISAMLSVFWIRDLLGNIYLVNANSEVKAWSLKNVVKMINFIISVFIYDLVDSRVDTKLKFVAIIVDFFGVYEYYYWKVGVTM